MLESRNTVSQKQRVLWTFQNLGRQMHRLTLPRTLTNARKTHLLLWPKLGIWCTHKHNPNETRKTMTKKKITSITQQCKLAHTYTYTTDSHDFFLQMQIKILHKRIFTKQNTLQTFAISVLINCEISSYQTQTHYTNTPGHLTHSKHSLSQMYKTEQLN